MFVGHNLTGIASHFVKQIWFTCDAKYTMYRWNSDAVLDVTLHCTYVIKWVKLTSLFVVDGNQFTINNHIA